jgi:hypothetical protein
MNDHRIDHRTDPGVDRLWDEFHLLVTMSPDELRRWLLADAAGEDAFPSRTDRGISAEGNEVLRVLGRRRHDLTDADLAVMRRTVDRILDLLSVRAGVGGPGDERWRHDLMDLGHDPFKDSRTSR